MSPAPPKKNKKQKKQCKLCGDEESKRLVRLMGRGNGWPDHGDNFNGWLSRTFTQYI
jgi:hypothetical protein